MGSEHVPFKKKSKIADALLGCKCIKDEDSRRRVLDDLNSEEKFRGIVKGISRGNDSRTHVMNIIDTCLNRPGSLERMVEIVVWYEGGDEGGGKKCFCSEFKEGDA